MTRTDVEIEDLIHDLRDRIQFYEPVYKRRMNRLNEEALIRRAYTVLTNIEMTSREYEAEIKDLEQEVYKLEMRLAKVGVDGGYDYD